MLDMWTDFIKIIAIFSGLLLSATFLRAKLKILQNFYVPNSVIAGLLGFIIFSLITKIFNIKLLNFENYIYHFLGITFIALSLKKSEGSKGKDAVRTAFSFALSYGLQAFIGFGLALIIFSRFFPKFNPINGILVQLGFSQSPSVAHNIALGWQKIILSTPNLSSSFLEDSGIIYSTDIGLTFGAIGFLIAIIVGVILIKYGVKKGYTAFLKDEDVIEDYIKKGFVETQDKKVEAGKQTTVPEAIDTLTLHIAIVLTIYIATFYLLKLFLFGIEYLPEGFAILAKVIVSFHFIIGALIAMLVKKVMYLFKIDFLLDNGIANRISGLSVDFMVTASLAAISIKVVINFIIPIITISAAAGIVTILYCAFFISRSFDNYRFERFITIFGIATGTIATGIALLRVLDPEFKSPVASDIMYGSGLAFFIGMPIMILINLPLRALLFKENYLNWLSLLFVFVYILFVIFIWRLLKLIKFKRPYKKLYLD